MDEKLDPKLKAFLEEKKDRLTSYDDHIIREDQSSSQTDPIKEKKIQNYIHRNTFVVIAHTLRDVIISLLSLVFPSSNKK